MEQWKDLKAARELNPSPTKPIGLSREHYNYNKWLRELRHAVELWWPENRSDFVERIHVELELPRKARSK